MNMTNHLKAESWNFKRNGKCNLTIPQETEMIERYLNGETFSNMTEDYGVNRQSLWKIATKTYNIEPYQTVGYPAKYDLNIDVFNDIHNEKSMYALGLIYSDGHISYDRLFFDTVDKEQLNNFRDCLETDKDYTTYSPEEENYKKQYRFAVKYQPMIADLRKLTPDFSKNTTEINSKIVNSSYFNHFLRGFLDGDGSTSNGVVVFTGKEPLMRNLRQIIERKYDTKASSFIKMEDTSANSESNFYHLNYYKKKAIRKLHLEIYNDATLFLTRKKKNLDSFLDN